MYAKRMSSYLLYYIISCTYTLISFIHFIYSLLYRGGTREACNHHRGTLAHRTIMGAVPSHARRNTSCSAPSRLAAHARD